MLEWIALAGWCWAAAATATAAYWNGVATIRGMELEREREAPSNDDWWRDFNFKMAADYQKRTDTLAGNLAVVSERLANLKLKEGAVEDKPIPFTAGEPARPYSEKLFKIISKIEHDEALEYTEDFIEAQRELGKHDDQIAELLERGEY